jgi:hypothetical protein
MKHVSALRRSAEAIASILTPAPRRKEETINPHGEPSAKGSRRTV